MEGLVRVGFFDVWKDKMNEKFSEFLPGDLIFDTEEKKKEIAKAVKEFYFGEKIVENDTILAYIDYFSDIMFTYPMLRAVKLQLESGHDQIYLYEYSFVDEDSTVVPYTNVRGAEHCAQTMAVFGRPALAGIKKKLTEEFIKSSATIRQIWANFIKTG